MCAHVHIFCCKMVHCAVGNWCIVELVQQVYWRGVDSDSDYQPIKKKVFKPHAEYHNLSIGLNSSQLGQNIWATLVNVNCTLRKHFNKIWIKIQYLSFVKTSFENVVGKMKAFCAGLVMSILSILVCKYLQTTRPLLIHPSGMHLSKHRVFDWRTERVTMSPISLPWFQMSATRVLIKQVCSCTHKKHKSYACIVQGWF